MGQRSAAPVRSHNQACTPSGVAVVHQREPAMFCIVRMSANVLEIPSPAHGERGFLTALLAPHGEVIARGMKRDMASLVCRLRLSAALRAIGDVMLIHAVPR